MPNPTAAELKAFIVQMLDEVSPYAREQFGQTGPLRFKMGHEAITHVDAEIEDRLSGRILDRFPDHGIHGEERGRQGESAAWQWHIDPIDGTLNYSLGIPLFSCSVAVSHNDQLVAGGVADPLRGEIFSAGRGEGAYVGQERIHVSNRVWLGEAIVSLQTSRQGIFVRDRELLQKVHIDPLKTRRLGSIALELAFVAAGRFDLLLAGKKVPQNLYDVAAGLLLVEEAGGRVTDGQGKPFREGSIELVASNGHIHDESLAMVEPYISSDSSNS